jgi:hypothetical protein
MRTILVTANDYNGRGQARLLADAMTMNLPGGSARREPTCWELAADFAVAR